MGTQTAALNAVGDNGPTILNNTESWNGTNWTNENTMNTTRNAITGAGSQTSGLVSGGSTPAVSDATEEWNGEGLFSRTVTTD
jgi:hypothetical protein